ncbi:hypothetical protein GBAR_LOCUS14291, partial [Geodia barretti]
GWWSAPISGQPEPSHESLAGLQAKIMNCFKVDGCAGPVLSSASWRECFDRKYF